MILYLFKSTVCLGLLLVFYFGLLERENMYRFNRWYLLGSLFAALLIPLLRVPKSLLDSLPRVEQSIGSTFSAMDWSHPSEAVLEISYLFASIYAIGVALLLFRLGRNVMRIVGTIRSNPKVSQSLATLVLIPRPTLPHTFLRYIFIHQQSYLSQSIEEELLTHELAHVRQKHSLDILLVELLHAFFWFNPGIIFLKKAIRLNHEFLADQATLQQHRNVPAYQQLLLKETTGSPATLLVNHFHFAHIKKRFLMMGQSSSRGSIVGKQMLVLPLVAGLLFFFADYIPTALQPSSSPPHNTEQLDSEPEPEEQIPEALEKYDNWLRGKRYTSQPLG